MNVTFSKISHVLYSIRVQGADNAFESKSLESKSLVLHDFIHYGVESEAKEVNGFWGNVLSNKIKLDASSQDQLTPFAKEDRIFAVEAIVGSLHNFDQISDLDGWLNNFLNYAENFPWEIPAWLNRETLRSAQIEYCNIKRRWYSTPTRGALTLPLSWIA